MLLLVSCAEDLFNGGDGNSNFIPNFDSDSTLSVITWNVEWFPKHLQTVKSMAELIVDLNSNIFGLQEITNSSDFNQLINKINDLDSLDQWVGFRAGDGNYQELAYIIKTSLVNIIDTPYSILNEYDHYFAYREPYVIKVSYLNNEFIIINSHYKCCGDGSLEIDYWDEEYRRKQASLYLKSYIDNNFPNDNVIVIGDMNDELNDPVVDNVFLYFIQDNANYKFVDMDIALGDSTNWSYPGWPSHIDHILITNELFDLFESSASSVQTICLDEYINNYYQYISDHRPVGLRLVLNLN